MTLVVKNLPADEKDVRNTGSIPVWEVPWRTAWQPSPVFLPGESHGWRSLAGYSPWGHKRARHDLVTEQQKKKKSALIVITTLTDNYCVLGICRALYMI